MTLFLSRAAIRTLSCHDRDSSCCWDGGSASMTGTFSRKRPPNCNWREFGGKLEGCQAPGQEEYIVSVASRGGFMKIPSGARRRRARNW